MRKRRPKGYGDRSAASPTPLRTGLLEGRRGQAGLDLALEGEIDHQHGDHGDRHTGEQHRQIGRVPLLLLELDEALREHVALRIGARLRLHQHRGQDVLVPLAQGVEDPHADQSGLRHGQHDLEERPGVRGPVEHRRLEDRRGSVRKKACMKNTVNGSE